MLLKIAQQETEQLTSKKSVLELQMNSSSIIAALSGLEEKDVVEKEDEQYRIINPIVKYYVLSSNKN